MVAQRVAPLAIKKVVLKVEKWVGKLVEPLDSKKVVDLVARKAEPLEVKWDKELVAWMAVMSVG